MQEEWGSAKVAASPMLAADVRPGPGLSACNPHSRGVVSSPYTICTSRFNLLQRSSVQPDTVLSTQLTVTLPFTYLQTGCFGTGPRNNS